MCTEYEPTVAPPMYVSDSGWIEDVVRLVSRSEEHTSELQSRLHLVCRLLLEQKRLSRLDRCPRRGRGVRGMGEHFGAWKRHHGERSVWPITPLRYSLPCGWAERRLSPAVHPP